MHIELEPWRLLAAADSVVPDVGGLTHVASAGQGPSGWGSWAQVFQVVVVFINLLLVWYIFKTNRTDRRKDLERQAKVYWLQKVVLEPKVEEVFAFHKSLLSLWNKAVADAAHKRALHALDAELNEAASSHADVISRACKDFRFSVIPLLRAVVEESSAKRENAQESSVSEALDRILDDLEEELTTKVVELFSITPPAKWDHEKALGGKRDKVLVELYSIFRKSFE